MQKGRSFWPVWARFLHQWGLTEIAAVLLEAAGPLNLLFAQVVYAGRPFWGLGAREDGMTALANLFESQEESQSFAAFLREETTR
jgi:hypothetical protein